MSIYNVIFETQDRRVLQERSVWGQGMTQQGAIKNSLQEYRLQGNQESTIDRVIVEDLNP